MIIIETRPLMEEIVKVIEGDLSGSKEIIQEKESKREICRREEEIFKSMWEITQIKETRILIRAIISKCLVAKIGIYVYF